MKRNWKRLTDLLKLIKKTSAKRFFMGSFSNKEGYPDVKEMKCGTTYCALGLYAIKYPKRVFRFDELGFFSLNGNKCPVYSEVAADHFGISCFESLAIFFSTRTGSDAKRHVISSLKKILSERKSK